jgi:hypothetical protein
MSGGFIGAVGFPLGGSASAVGGGSDGDVIGPSSSTASAVARFDGTTGKALLNSSAILGDITQTTGNVLTISGADSLTTGSILRLLSNSSSTGARSLVNVINDHVDSVATANIRLQQDAPAPFARFVGTESADGEDPINSQLVANVVGFLRVEINGVKHWIPFYDDPVTEI